MALWGGRFSQTPADAVFALSRSVHFDWRLAPYDLRSSLAHLAVLQSSGLLEDSVANPIRSALNELITEVASGAFVAIDTDEDVHSALERGLTEKLGAIGGSLRAGRSRNDQVATDIRLYLRDNVQRIQNVLQKLLHDILDLAEQENETIMPGFTHLQAAQPISFGHHLLAYFEMFKRDKERLKESFKRINTMPLGSAALAGTSYPINRERTAELLSFERISLNSLDAVSDRDFAIEFASNASLIMMHLFRFSEELILWSSAQFEFIALPDSFCTGSSIMPQKKNPDVPELVRGKTGRVNGNLIALLTLMKGQPLAYNKDNQEDKEPLFDSVETIFSCLRVFSSC